MPDCATVSSIKPALDGMAEDLKAMAKEQNVSEVLLLVTLKSFCERRLESVINDGL